MTTRDPNEHPPYAPCGCGAKSVMCVHGADGAVWMCKECFNRLMIIFGRPTRD